MTTSKLKFVLFGTAAAAAVAALLLQHRSGVKLREENFALHEQVGQLAALEAENQGLSNLVAQLKKSAALPSPELAELLKLRGEIGRLREQASQVEKLRQENRQLRAQSASTQAPAFTPSPDSQMALPAGQRPPIAQMGFVPLGATREEVLAKLATRNARILTNTTDLIVAEFPATAFVAATIDPTTGAESRKPLTSSFTVALPFRDGKYDDTDTSAGDGVLRRQVPIVHFIKPTP